MNLIIDEEFEKLKPPVSESTYKNLEELILAHGCLEALVVWKGKNIILDGVLRYRICRKHNLSFNTRKMDFADRDSATEWIIRNELGRRHISGFQGQETALGLKPALQKHARERSDHRKDTGKNRNGELYEPGGTDAKLARLVGVSEKDIQRTAYILQHGTLQQIARGRAGGPGNSIHAIYNEVNREVRRRGNQD